MFFPALVSNSTPRCSETEFGLDPEPFFSWVRRGGSIGRREADALAFPWQGSRGAEREGRGEGRERERLFE